MNAWTMQSIKEANAREGHCWFLPETMRFFRCKVYADSVRQGPGGVYFVSSEVPWGNPRLYTVRVFNPATASVSTALASGGLAFYPSKRAALDVATTLANTANP